MVKESWISEKLSKEFHYHLYGYKISYGDECIRLVCRASLGAVVRSASIAGKYVGIYITGSLYSVTINGVKFVDYNGNFIEEQWKEMFDSLVNSTDVISSLDKNIRNSTNYRSHREAYAKILVGIDNRPSSLIICNALKETFSLMGNNISLHCFNVCTFPELVYLVNKSNSTDYIADNDYIEFLIKKTRELQNLTGNNIYLSVDTANGTVIKHLKELNKHSDLCLDILNPPNGIVQDKCGVEHVFTTKKPPVNLYSTLLSATFDADADSLLFFKTCNNSTRIYNGNNICTFLSLYIQKRVQRMKLDIMVIVSQLCSTSCLDFLQSRGFKIIFSPPGVKHFIEASRNYDISVMWEPKGHGTVIFSAETKAKLQKGGSSLFKEEYQGMEEDQKIMQCLTTFFSQHCTDALANLLIMKSLLYSHFDLNLYQETFTRTLTVKIASEIIIDQGIIISPANIQKKINYYKKHYHGKVYTRMSSTLEQTLRVSTEALDEQDCDKLALLVAQLIYDNCDGQGDHPEITYT